MPESAIAELPAETKAPESLKALFQLPGDLAVAPEKPEVDPEPKPAEKPPEKPAVEPEKPASTAPSEPKKDDLTARLAPDFAAVEAAPVVPVTPDADLVELDAAIEAAPTPKAKADLGKFRDQLAALKTENQTLKARPTAPAEDGDTKTVLEQTTKERDELLARLERYDLQASPAFQEKFMKPRQQKFDDARNIVKEAGGEADALVRAMSLTGKARMDALEEIAEAIPQQIMRGRFERLIEGIDNDTRIINEKLTNAKQAAQEEAKNETIRRHENNEKAAKEWKALLGAARSDLVENVKLETLVKMGKPEFEWWDKQVDEIDEVAEEILLKSTPQKAAVAAYLAASAGAFRSMFQAERKARLASDARVRELEGAEPTLSQDRTVTKTETDSVAPDDIVSRLRAGAYRK